MGTWTVTDNAIAPPRQRLTDRAARWATRQVGKAGRPVAEVARELDCDWHTVMDAVVAYGGALLAKDAARTAGVEALGLDETLFVRRGERHAKHWATSIVDVGGRGHEAKLVEVVEGRTAKAASSWIDAQPETCRAAICWATLDMSGPYRKAFNDSLSVAAQVADPFHIVKHANAKIDECRRRGPERHARPQRQEGRSALPVPEAAHQGPRAPGRRGGGEAHRAARSRRSQG